MTNPAETSTQFLVTGLIFVLLSQLGAWLPKSPGPNQLAELGIFQLPATLTEIRLGEGLSSLLFHPPSNKPGPISRLLGSGWETVERFSASGKEVGRLPFPVLLTTFYFSSLTGLWGFCLDFEVGYVTLVFSFILSLPRRGWCWNKTFAAVLTRTLLNLLSVPECPARYLTQNRLLINTFLKIKSK